MDIVELKHQARTLEQQGNLGQALETYRQILSEIDAIGGIRQELPVLIKLGDLYLKTGDVDQAVDSYERAAGEYAAQGAAQPVMSLCTKILRADPQAVGAYLRLARRLLDSGFPDGARDVLMDYAQRAKLEKTREGLERLAGRAEDEVKRVLAKAIESAEERLPKRTPRPKAPPAPPTPVAEEPEEPAPITLEPSPQPPEPAGPKKRLTVPVGALDAELDPSLLEMRPPEPRPPELPPHEVMPELAFPSAEDLQAPVVPEAPPPPVPPAAPPPVPPTIAPPPLVLEPTIAPPPMEGMLSTMPPAPAPPTPEAPPPPPPRLSVPMMEAVVEPPPPPRSPDAWGEEKARPSRSSRPSKAIPEEPPRVSRPRARPSRASARMAAPAQPSRAAPRWLWRLLGLIVVAGVLGALVWRQVIPLDRLRNLLPQGEKPGAAAPPSRPAPPPVATRPDTVMARDTAGVPVHPRAAARPAPTPPPPPVEAPPAALVAPTLPPGVALTRSVMLISGLRVESVSQIESEGKTGMAIVQLLSTGQWLRLEEFPTDTVGAGGEIGVTGIPPDTVVGHVRMADLEILLKAVGISEDRIVQFLQQLVEVKP